MDQVNVLVLATVRDADLASISAVDSRVTVLDGRRKFDVEYREVFPNRASQFLPAADAETEARSAAERDYLLSQADVMCVNFPYPTRLMGRTPRLKWLHQTAAGASNLRYGDIWGSSVVLTTSRGHASNTPHAEWALTTMLMFMKEMPRAFAEKQRGTFSGRQYRPRMLAGKTVGIVGYGGIGQETGRLARALGMRVLGTRRSVRERVKNANGADELFPPFELHEMLAECDFVVVAAQSTPETARMIGPKELAAMKSSSFLINLARGEIIDEDALIAALRDGTIAGAGLDVYENEFEVPPRPELVGLPNVIFTPHISGGTDVHVHRGIELFCDNLRRFLAGQELVNVVQRERGY